VRFPDFLRAATLLFAGSASALAFVATVGAGGTGDLGLAVFAVVWWTFAAMAGAYLGRRPEASTGIARLMATARQSPALPELEPGTVLVNRLWGLLAYTVVAGGVGFLLPPVPAVAAGYALLVSLSWRKQAAAVSAVEGRDGVRFYVDRTSPFKPTRLIRTPGFRTLERAEGRREPQPEAVECRPARRASSSAQERVLATWCGAIHPRRAVATAYPTAASVSGPWASESSTSVTPASTARRAFVSDRSRRSGLPFTSRKVLVRAAASNTRSRSSA
jgi:hypothetical protein